MKKRTLFSLFVFLAALTCCSRRTMQVEVPSMNTGEPDTVMVRTGDMIRSQ